MILAIISILKRLYFFGVQKKETVLGWVIYPLSVSNGRYISNGQLNIKPESIEKMEGNHPTPQKRMN